MKWLQHKFTIRDSATCKSSNLVYLINCAHCQDVQYVGETGNTLQIRFNGHRSDIRRKQDTLVARHFCGPDHSLSDLRCCVIELMKTEDVQKRKERERMWRHKLKTNYPFGLNVWD